MNLQLFELGPFAFQTQGLFTALGVLIGLVVIFYQAWKAGEDGLMITWLVVASIAIAIIVGRIAYHISVEAHIDGSVFVRRGGVSAYAFICASVLSLFVGSRFVGIEFIKLLDLIVIGTLIALLFFFSAAFLTDTMTGIETGLPWAVERLVLVGKKRKAVQVHPISIYYAAWMVLTGLYLFVRRDSLFFKGQLVSLSLLCFLPGIIILDWFRAGDAWFALGPVRVSQPQVIAAVVLLFLAPFYYFIRQRMYDKL